MATTRRKAATAATAAASSESNTSSSSSAAAAAESKRPTNTKLSSPQTSPFLPTPLELSLLSIYPITLVLGSAFSLISPHVRASSAIYSPQHQSFQPAASAPSYFAQKRNVFNIYFVKVGWLWTSAALALFALTHPLLGPALSPTPTPRRARLALRWALASGVWFLTTQWFFGPALIDRSFRWTGGACQILRDEEAVESMGEVREILTHAACKLAGGTWSGGIDISGHVFLLILGSALLWMEVLPTVLRASGLREERMVRMSDGRVVSAMAEGEQGEQGVSSGSSSGQGEGEVTKLGVKVAVGVVALSWWMLLMTAAFFHTWSEKLTGLMVALFGIWIVYFLPRGVPAVRAIIGMPGV